MGCLNSRGDFPHWFAGIHLSGPCNRKCYFCIGQHMMALDPLNNLDTFPLKNFEPFMAECRTKAIHEMCVSGTNTDPLLYKHTDKLLGAIRQALPGTPIAIRTNGVADRQDLFGQYDKASITVCSTNADVYRAMMGRGIPPNLKRILHDNPTMDIRINIVLGPENVANGDIFRTLDYCADLGVTRVNLREPYGQPHIGDPMPRDLWSVDKLGMPVYHWRGVSVMYWDVHFVEVESINLYANGNISADYPITRGHDVTGEVREQSQFPGGRIREQWLGSKSQSSASRWTR
jgi:pyruvate-formate lyase-activating enzyme